MQGIHPPPLTKYIQILSSQFSFMHRIGRIGKSNGKYFFGSLNAGVDIRGIFAFRIAVLAFTGSLPLKQWTYDLKSIFYFFFINYNSFLRNKRWFNNEFHAYYPIISAFRGIRSDPLLQLSRFHGFFLVPHHFFWGGGQF